MRCALALSFAAVVLAVGCSGSEPSGGPTTPAGTSDGGRGEDGATTTVPASDGGDAAPAFDLYDQAVVPKFELTFDEAAMTVLESTEESTQKTWVRGAFKYGTLELKDVGVRRKGSSTFRALPKKAALKIRFDKYVEGQRFVGLTDLTLNNSLSDPSHLAERLAYHVFRSAGLPAQKASPAELVINGAPYGLYLNVETPDKDLVQRLFGANAKSLYEIGSNSEWQPGGEDGFEEEVGDESAADVLALTAAVGAATSENLLAKVAPTLDTTEWLRFSATEAAVGHYDGYGFGAYGSHNYFMAGDAKGVFSLLPWSADLTFSDRQVLVDAAEPKNVDGGPTLLMRCKASAPCWTAYKTEMRSVLATYEKLDLVKLAKAWHTQIDPLVQADPKREDPLSYYASETEALYTWIAKRPGVVRAQLKISP